MMIIKPNHKELLDKIMAGVNESMDKLILERMTINIPLIIERDGKVQEVSPFILEEERWGQRICRALEKRKSEITYSLYL